MPERTPKLPADSTSETNPNAQTQPTTQTNESASQKSDLLTTGQAAKILGVSRQTVRRWIDTGSLHGARLDKNGGHFRLNPREVNERAEKMRSQLGQDDGEPETE